MSPLTDEDDTGEDFAFSLPDIGALIAGPLPSLGPDDLTAHQSGFLNSKSVVR